MNYENYDPSFPDQPVVDLYLSIWANLPAFRSKPAFIWSNHSSPTSVLTYSQLNDSVELISTRLLNSLLRRENVVILCQPGLELVEIIFGCQRAGLLSIPIFPPNPCFNNKNYHQLVRVFSQTKPKAAIADEDYIGRVHAYMSSSTANGKVVELLRQVKWISTFELKNKNKDLNVKSSRGYNGCSPDDVYLIQYTSGATGIQKPVMVTAGSAVHNVRVARKAYDLHPNSIIASWLPQYHDCGLQFLLLTIVSGATSVLTSPLSFLSRPRLWLELISDFKATHTPVPSFALPLVVKRGRITAGSRTLNLSTLKNLIIINEPIYQQSIDEFIAVFEAFGLNPSSVSPSYGLAENCTFVSTAWRSNSGFNLPAYKKLLPISRLDGDEEEDMEIVIVNEETNESVSDGIEGEIWVSSPSNCSGYLHHPNLTREIFQARLKNRVSRCFVRTGDRGIIRGEERFLYVIGRCSDVIKLKTGREIHPHYIESAAQNRCRNFLRGGCLAAFEVGSNMIALVAEMQVRVQNGVVLRNICEEIRKGVMEEERVDIGGVVLVESGNVPKTTSGKVQRWATKIKLIEGQMNVLMEVAFGKNNSVEKNKSKMEEQQNGVIGERKDTISRSLISHL